MPDTGNFIVLDGPDGSGTTTHSRLLADAARSMGRDVLLTAEPTGAAIGKWIRAYLDKGEGLPPDALQLLFCADRAAHLANVIEPALAAGKVVICDRYVSSTIAYGEAMGLDPAWLVDVNKKFIRPNALLFLLAPVDVCATRLGHRSALDQLEGRDLQERVHASYARMAREDDRIVTIDTSGPQEEVTEQIRILLKNNF